MTFADKSSNGRTFQQVTHKGGKSLINYIKILQNSQALSFSLGNTYSEYQLMHTFLDNFHQGEKYSAQIDIHQAELRREQKFTDQKYLSISSLHTNYLNIDSILGCDINSERANNAQTKCNFCGGATHSEEKNSKGLERKRKKIVWLVFRTTDERNGRLGNVLDVDLKIT